MDIEALKQMAERRNENDLVEVLQDVELDEKPRVAYASPIFLDMLLSQYN